MADLVCEKCGSEKNLPHNERMSNNITVWHCFASLALLRKTGQEIVLDIQE